MHHRLRYIMHPENDSISSLLIYMENVIKY